MKQTLIRLMLKLLLASFAIAVSAAEPKGATYTPEEGSAAEKMGAGKWAFKPDPKLPNVLILGDSISVGYTMVVRKLLTGKANVFRPSINCQGTTFGVEKIDGWLAGQKWAVIHFNWGLHDLKHVKVAGKSENSNSPTDPLQATVVQYSKNMERLVDKMKTTGAKLVFATTTPVAPGTTNPLREPEAPGKYNASAVKIMAAQGIKVNDLYGSILPHLSQLQLPNNVHFTPEGSKVLAEQVAKAIETELEL
ncbi:MAG: SGNH/GDSL hydrolase family protein [Opitutaceae bacterium]